MGYKSFVRSAVAASNKAQREAQRQHNAHVRLQERLQKKIDKIEDKKEKIVDALQDEYAKGKITENRYSELMERKEDIPLDLLVFGGAPGVSAAKRYITGKIEERDFKKISNELVPIEVRQEAQEMVESFSDFVAQLEQFVNECEEREGKICWHCNRGGFFRFVRFIQRLNLCYGCRAKLNALSAFKGIEGSYYEMQSVVFDLNDIKSSKPKLLIRNECLLS